MNPLGLPFDIEAMLLRLRPWVECESPTFDAIAVERMIGLVARDLALIGAEIERLPGRMGYAGAARARLAHRRRGEPGILIMGHLDTVHPISTLQTLAWRREDGRCYGPGVLDMKGGNCIAVEALARLAAAGIETPLPVTYLLTGDEEVGTPSSRDIVEAEAARNKYVLVPEPARQSGAVVSGRYAIARFNLETRGRPSHAGSRLSEGRSAIREMARRVVEIEAMTSEDCTFSVGVIHGGQWVNCVSSNCMAEALSMAKRQGDLDDGVARMLALSETGGEIEFRVSRGVTRPVWEADAGTLALLGLAKRLARDIGFELLDEAAGGGSDGNFTGAMGIPTLDGLGAHGDGAHTLNEHIFEESLVERGRLFAGMLATLN